MSDIKDKTKTIIRNILQKIEKYTKTDITYIITGGSWLVIGQGTIAILSFFLSVAFANLISQETLGTYRFVLSVLGILSIPTLGGINTALTRAVANHKDGTFFPSLKTKIYWGTLGGIGSGILSLYYFVNENTDLSLAFLIASVFLPFMDSFILYDSVLQGKKDFKTSTVYFIFSHIIAFCTIMSVLYLTPSLPILILAYFISWTGARGLFLFLTAKKYTPKGDLDHSAIPYGKHLSAMGIIGTIANSLDRLLVFHFLGAAELAIYSIIIGPPEQIKGLLKHIHTLSLPKFASSDKSLIKKTIWSKTIKFTFIISGIVIVYIICAPYFFEVFFPKYKEFVNYSILYSLSLIPLALLLPYSFLESSGSTKELYQYNIWSSGVEIALVVLLIPYGGLLGIIYARILSRAFNFVLTNMMTKKI